MIDSLPCRLSSSCLYCRANAYCRQQGLWAQTASIDRHLAFRPLFNDKPFQSMAVTFALIEFRLIQWIDDPVRWR